MTEQLNHIACPGGPTLCGIEYVNEPFLGPNVLAYDFCSLGTRGGWCPACAQEAFMPDWPKEKIDSIFAIGLSNIIQGLSQSLSGAGDPMSGDDFWYFVDYLEYRKHVWTPSQGMPWAALDEAMATYLDAALDLVYAVEQGKVPYWSTPSRPY